MAVTVSITDDQISTALRSLLIGICPAPFEAVLGQANRVPEPATPDFAIYTPTGRRRLATNLHAFDDCKFTASVAGTQMTVTAFDPVVGGQIVIGRTLFGANVAAGTTVTDGPAGGGTGIYTLSIGQTIDSQVFATGAFDVTQETEVDVQIDVHGPNSANNAQAISTLFRDDYAVAALAAGGVEIWPLDADDPTQIPFVNGESQWEDRWVIRAKMQVNPVIAIPQEYADSAVVGLIDVDAAYPPT